MPQSNTVTNEDILELLQESMQMTSDGFVRIDVRFDGLEGRMDSLQGRMDGLDGRMDSLQGRMDGLDGRMDSLQGRMGQFEHQYGELKEIVEKIANEQTAQTNDIKEVLDRLLALEKRLPNITENELREMQTKLQAIVDWATEVAALNKVPLKLSGK